ncbi:hypothetical protein F5884DRAFT_837754 [Xylogone sp. PMI_703]|nr:hypothetical protein F5884DRAFT_837754 [Xylogone sp. PMI_703]
MAAASASPSVFNRRSLPLVWASSGANLGRLYLSLAKRPPAVALVPQANRAAGVCSCFYFCSFVPSIPAAAVLVDRFGLDWIGLDLTGCAANPVLAVVRGFPLGTQHTGHQKALAMGMPVLPASQHCTVLYHTALRYDSLPEEPIAKQLEEPVVVAPKATCSFGVVRAAQRSLVMCRGLGGRETNRARRSNASISAARHWTAFRSGYRISGWYLQQLSSTPTSDWTGHGRTQGGCHARCRLGSSAAPLVRNALKLSDRPTTPNTAASSTCGRIYSTVPSQVLQKRGSQSCSIQSLPHDDLRC